MRTTPSPIHLRPAAGDDLAFVRELFLVDEDSLGVNLGFQEIPPYR